MNSSEECYAEQKNHIQIAMPTQVDQISPSTSRRSVSTMPALPVSFLRGTLSAYIRSTSTSNKFTFSSSKIAATTTTSVTSRNHGRLLNEWCRENISSKDTRITLKKVAVNVKILSSQNLTPHLGS